MSGALQFLVWFVDFVVPRKPPGALLGVKIRDKIVLRPAGESEEKFLKRLEVEQLEGLKAENDPQHLAVGMLAIRSGQESGRHHGPSSQASQNVKP